MTVMVSSNIGMPKDVQKAKKFAPVWGLQVQIPAGQLLSVNVGPPREIGPKGRTVRTVLWKDAVRDRRETESEEPCILPPHLGAETSAAKDENH